MKKKNKRLVLNLDVKTHEKLKAISSKEKISMNEIIRQFISNGTIIFIQDSDEIIKLRNDLVRVINYMKKSDQEELNILEQEVYTEDDHQKLKELRRKRTEIRDSLIKIFEDISDELINRKDVRAYGCIEDEGIKK